MFLEHKKLIGVWAFIFTVSVSFLYSPLVYGNVENGSGGSGAEQLPTSPIHLSTIGGYLARIVNIAFWGAGALFVVMILITAIKYSMSQGDPKGLEGAKNTLTYAVFGFLVAIGFFAISSIITTTIGIDEGILTSPATKVETGIDELESELTKWGDKHWWRPNYGDDDTSDIEDNPGISVEETFYEECFEHVQSGNWYCDTNSDFSSGSGCINFQGGRVCRANEGPSSAGGCVLTEDGHKFCQR